MILQEGDIAPLVPAGLLEFSQEAFLMGLPPESRSVTGAKQRR